MSSASNTTEPSTEQKSATLLDGKALAKQIEQSLSQRVATLKDKTGRTPSLATILVGADPASATYVRMKGNACKRCIKSPLINRSGEIYSNFSSPCWRLR
mgnify:CR=1 FL=1